jgi:hypothetical protein
MATATQPGDDPTAAPLTKAKPAGFLQILSLGLGLVLLCLILVYALLSLWPGNLKDKTGDELVQVTLFATSISFPASIDAEVLLLVMVTGALGSFIHTATSFSDFVGNQKLSTNWVWWYILRPFIGMALAAVFYVSIRAGLLTGGGQPATINVFGIAAMSGMVGLFAKQATDKLSEVFDTVFRTAHGDGDQQRKDSLESPVPVLRVVDPAAVSPGGTPPTVAVLGSGFTSGSVVKIRDSDRPTVYKSSGELAVTLLAGDVEAGGELEVVVVTPPPGGGRSGTATLRVIDSLSGTQTAAAATGPATAADEILDGCEVAILDATPDEALPAARGGVA